MIEAVIEPAVKLPFAPLQNDEFLRLVINSIRNDITGRNEPFQCLALNFIGSGERRRARAVPCAAIPQVACTQAAP